jgi:hypothetical protein
MWDLEAASPGRPVRGCQEQRSEPRQTLARPDRERRVPLGQHHPPAATPTAAARSWWIVTPARGPGREVNRESGVLAIAHKQGGPRSGSITSSEQVSAALRNGLDDRYDVLPGMRITRIRTGSPHAPSQTTTARTTLASGQRFWVRTNCITLTCRFPVFRKRICALQCSAHV